MGSRIIKNSLQIGTNIGGISGIIYALLLLLAFELYLPHPNRSVIVIFTFDNIPSILLITLVVGFFLPSMIGACTAGIYGFILEKFNSTRRHFIITCVLLSVVFTLPVNALVATRYSGYDSLESFRYTLTWNGHLLEDFLLTVAMIPVPSLIYIGISLFISRYLYDWLKPVSNASSPSSQIL